MEGRLSRRDFLALAVSLIALLRDGALAAPGPSRGEVRGKLFEFHPVTAAQLAPYTAPYLAGHPAEADPDRLLGLLFPGGTGQSPEQLKEAVRKRHRMDFEEGRTVSLDGWILSVTEVRLWCLYGYLAA